MARTCPQCGGVGRVIKKPCQTCHGNGRVARERKLTVKIPAGIATAQRLRLSGEGEHGGRGGRAGDLYVVIHVQEHAFFHREGDDLLCEVPVTYPTLALGGEIEVPTLTDPATIQIPTGTQPNTRFRLRGKGMPDVGGRGHGDLYVEVKVAVPRKLSREQKTPHRETRRDNASAGARPADHRTRRRPAVLRPCQGHLRVVSRVPRRPALDVRGPAGTQTPLPLFDAVAAAVDDFMPFAIEERGPGVVRVYFASESDPERRASGGHGRLWPVGQDVSDLGRR